MHISSEKNLANLIRAKNVILGWLRQLAVVSVLRILLYVLSSVVIGAGLAVLGCFFMFIPYLNV